MALEKATRKRVRMRGEIHGPSGSGKTATALMFATALAQHYKGEIAVLDTQGGQSLDYVGTKYAPNGFDVDIINDKSTVERIRGAFAKVVAAGKYAVCIIDSFSSVWAGDGGILDQAAKIDDKDRFKGWGALKGPLKSFMTDIHRSPLHVICTVRVDTDYVFTKETNDKGKEVTVIRRVGTKPVQEKNINYEFSFQARMDEFHVMTVERTSCEAFDRAVIQRPDMETIVPLIEWMEQGVSETALDRVLGRKCSKDQIREYMDLAKRLGYKEDAVISGFADAFGLRIEDSSEELLGERIEVFQERLEKKLAASIRPVKNSDAAAT